MENTEFDLVVSTKIIWQKKSFIFLVTLLFAIVSAVFSFVLPSKYDVVTIIEPGSRLVEDTKGVIVDEGLFELPEVIQQKIISGFFDRKIQLKLGLNEVDYPEISASVPSGSNVVIVNILAADTKGAIEILNEVNRLISDDIGLKVAIEKEIYKNKIKSTEVVIEGDNEKISLLKRQIVETKNKVLDLDKKRYSSISSEPSSSMSVLLYTNEIQSQQEYLNNLELKLQAFILHQKIKRLELEKTIFLLSSIKNLTIKQVPFSFVEASSPKKVLIIIVSTFFGFFVSVIFLFIVEIYRKSKGIV